MAVNVMVDGEGRVEAEERWTVVPEPPYILTPEDAKNLRGTLPSRASERKAAVESWKRLEPIFTAKVWQQVLGHLEGQIPTRKEG